MGNSNVDLDLILKGGVVIDPAQGLHQKMDVALKDGNIAALKEAIDDHAARVIDVSGQLIVPGLIDLHTHVYWGDPNSLLDGRGKIIPELKDARQRKVVLDLGHGAGGFSLWGLLAI